MSVAVPNTITKAIYRRIHLFGLQRVKSLITGSMAVSCRSKKLRVHIFKPKQEAQKVNKKWEGEGDYKHSKPYPDYDFCQQGSTPQKFHDLLKQHHWLETKCPNTKHLRLWGAFLSQTSSVAIILLVISVKISEILLKKTKIFYWIIYIRGT